MVRSQAPSHLCLFHNNAPAITEIDNVSSLFIVFLPLSPELMRRLTTPRAAMLSSNLVGAHKPSLPAAQDLRSHAFSCLQIWPRTVRMSHQEYQACSPLHSDLAKIFFVGFFSISGGSFDRKYWNLLCVCIMWFLYSWSIILIGFVIWNIGWKFFLNTDLLLNLSNSDQTRPD
jgi:hypothetical protein